MAFRLSQEMLLDIAQIALGKGRIIVLVKNSKQADKVSDRLRTVLGAEIQNQGLTEGPRPTLLKPVGQNPSFVQLTQGGWVFIWPAQDMAADDPLGSPELVYWPSEGGAYEKVTYQLWKQHRLAGDIYRPVTVQVVPRHTGPRTVWERLLDDEEENP